jgi:hypothetical protein
MARYLSPEWVQAFNRALGPLDLTAAITEAGAGSLTASDGTFAVAQVVTDGPDGPVRAVFSVRDGHASFESDPDEALP